jgi:hypothetical protein
MLDLPNDRVVCRRGEGREGEDEHAQVEPVGPPRHRPPCSVAWPDRQPAAQQPEDLTYGRDPATPVLPAGRRESGEDLRAVLFPVVARVGGQQPAPAFGAVHAGAVPVPRAVRLITISAACRMRSASCVTAWVPSSVIR